jgi:hypothetical protein
LFDIVTQSIKCPVTGCRTGVQFPEEQGFFFSPTDPMDVTGILFPGVKRKKREADYSP